ncbi:hypothetical protein ARSEF1564_005371 [Beauveria bassiana]
MENEPVPKRRRTASPPLVQDSNSSLHPPILPQDEKLPGGADDKAYQQHLERAFADPRFRATLAQIFNKYDGKSAETAEAIDPALCTIPAGDINLVDPTINAQLGTLAHPDSLPYHLDTQQCDPREDEAGTVNYQVDQTNETPVTYAPDTAPPAYMPAVAGSIHSGFVQNWYGNPFPGSGPYAPPWDGFSGQFPVPNGAPMPPGPWIAPENLTYGPATWPPQGMQPASNIPTLQLDPALMPSHFTLGYESTDNCPPEMEITYDALGRKRRRRPPQPRFSKNGKRLGRPPKPSDAPGAPTGDVSVPDGDVSVPDGDAGVPSGDTGAYDGGGEDNGGLPDLENPAGEFGDEDDDTLWGELAEALKLASNATSKKRNRDGTKPASKGENSGTESDGAAERDRDASKAETMLRKIQKELIDRAVRRSTAAKEHGDELDVSAEGRRRSGRERKPANFGEQVSWEKVSAERRTSYKIKMHLRALSVQARRERKKKEKEEAEEAAKEKEAAEKAKKEKQQAEELAAPAAEKATAEESSEEIPSTIPDSQDSVTSLPIRTTPKKPQSTQIMRQTMKNHVNSVVHFEEDDEGISDDQAPAAFSIKNPVFSYKKPEVQVHSFLGENYIDTVYALSDDEAPALLSALKRVSIGGKKKPPQVPVAVVRRSEAVSVSKQSSSKAVEQTTTAKPVDCHRSKEVTPSNCTDTNVPLDDTMGMTEAVSVPPCKTTESDEAGRPSLPTGGDGDDSGIDVRSEQASSEQASNEAAERQPVSSISVPAEPPFQDDNLLGAADILDSLDVMSEVEDASSSPISQYDFAKEDTHINNMAVASTNSEPVPSPSIVPEQPMFVDEEPMYESMDIFEDVAADIPLTGEETEMEYTQTVEPTTKVPEQSAQKNRPVEKEPEQVPVMMKYEFTKAVFVREEPDKFDIDTEENTRSYQSNLVPVSPAPRRPLPQQSKSKRHDNRKSITSLTSMTSTPNATSKESSPSSIGERSRLPSSSSSRTPAPVSGTKSARHGSSSSRRSLLSLVGGGEDDIETLIKKKPTTPAPKQASAVTPAHYSSKSKTHRSSSYGSSSSRRKSKQPSSSSSSSLTRLSLGALSSFSRDKSKSSRDRQEAKERRRKSASAAPPSVDASAEQKGTCGIDGYTCGRDFCFTCL